MSLSLPDISISITAADRLVVTVTRPDSEPLKIPTRLAPIQLAEYRTEFYKGLKQFLGAIATGAKVSDFGVLSVAVERLHRAGRTLSIALFGNDNRHVIENFFLQSCPTWRRSGSDGYRAPIVRVTSLMEHSLPLEFLPLFETRKPGVVGNIDQLSQAMACFPAFSMIVQRRFIHANVGPAAADPPAPLENSPNLPVRFFRHAGLTGARKEREYLQAAEWIDLRGPWPDRSLPKQDFLVEFASLLWDEQAQLEVADEAPDQIHHFACHCNTEHDASLDHTLTLGNLNNWGWPSVREVTIGDLQGEFGSYPVRSSATPRPLIFLNACGSSKFNPAGIASFPDMFLSAIGNRGVIGTETPIPDSFAALFSEQFYFNLIQGVTLGEAIFKARWTLLKRLNNPLGILYSVYADPFLHVRRPIPDAVLPSHAQIA